LGLDQRPAIIIVLSQDMTSGDEEHGREKEKKRKRRRRRTEREKNNENDKHFFSQ
jgi:hypothetical protein